MHLVCYGFYLEALEALQDTSTNIERMNVTRKNSLLKHLVPGSNLVSFLNEGNCLGFGICAPMLCWHSSVRLCRVAATTTLRGRRI